MFILKKSIFWNVNFADENPKSITFASVFFIKL